MLYSLCSQVLFTFFWWGGEDRVSLCSLGYPRTSSVDQADLKLTEPASASRVLGLKVCRAPLPLANSFSLRLFFN